MGPSAPSMMASQELISQWCWREAHWSMERKRKIKTIDSHFLNSIYKPQKSCPGLGRLKATKTLRGPASQSVVRFLSHHWRLSKTWGNGAQWLKENISREILRQLVQSSLLAVLGSKGKGEESELAVHGSPQMPESTDLFPLPLPSFLSPSSLCSFLPSFWVSSHPPSYSPQMLPSILFLWYVLITKYSKITIGIIKKYYKQRPFKMQQLSQRNCLAGLTPQTFRVRTGPDNLCTGSKSHCIPSNCVGR